MSAATTLISVEDYLQTSYDPDVEYVDGALVERDEGWLHSVTQNNLIVTFRRRYPNIYAVPELRFQTRKTRYRLPNVTVLLAPPKARLLVDATFLVIEILSSNDKMSDVMEKLAEYATKGVPNIWLIDPRLKTVFVYLDGDLKRVRENRVATEDPRLEVTMEEIFCGLRLMDTEENYVASPEEQEIIRKVVWQLEMSPTGRCLECGRGRMFHLLRPLMCAAVVGMLRARLDF